MLSSQMKLETEANSEGHMVSLLITLLTTQILSHRQVVGVCEGSFVCLQERVADDLRVSQKVAALGGVLEHISRQAPLPTFSTASAQVYSVELLDLRVRSA